ncbi:MAG: hypothetical protein LBU11_00270 [Zoogloeaceae bacterium]|nr:hypothetical protein [Zoogloeaceae bacterium]
MPGTASRAAAWASARQAGQEAERLEAAARDGVDAALAELDTWRYQKRQELVIWLRPQAKTMEFTRMTEALRKAGGEEKEK